MEDSLVGIRRELKEMRKRENEQKVKREKMEKRMGKLELKLEKGLKIEALRWRRGGENVGEGEGKKRER